MVRWPSSFFRSLTAPVGSRARRWRCWSFGAAKVAVWSKGEAFGNHADVLLEAGAGDKQRKNAAAQAEAKHALGAEHQDDVGQERGPGAEVDQAGDQERHVEYGGEEQGVAVGGRDDGGWVGEPLVEEAGGDLVEAGGAEEGYLFAEAGLRQ